MNDYSIGAVEALSWAYAVLQGCEGLESFRAARREIEGMIMRLASGAAVSFKRKTDFIPELRSR